MSGFTPFKKHANKFNYLPRYYDPEKEERDRRRAELRGERAEDAAKSISRDSISVRKVRPGRPPPRRDVARLRPYVDDGRTGRAGALFLVFGYPRVVAFISDMQKPKTPQTEEFNPYTPITVVPNDYEE